MTIKGTDEVSPKREEARLLMERALALLDETDAPAEIGAHLDLAICSLRETIGEASARSGPARLTEQRLPQDSCAWPMSHAPLVRARSGGHQADRSPV